jgi:hypothetical protein
LKIINWAFIAIFGACGCLWIWETIDARREAAAANAFYAKEIAPGLNTFKRDSDAWTEAYKQRQLGKIVPLPDVKIPNSALNKQWFALIQARSRSSFTRDRAFIGLLVTVSAWTILALFRGMFARLKWESPDRMASPTAGKIIGELVSSGIVFVAKTDDEGVNGPRVEVDGRRSVVVFRHLTFVTAFVGNPERDLREVPFRDLIVGTISNAKGRLFFQLRTAQGKVTITYSIKPFMKLVGLLQDAAEQNRTFPDRFKDALSREPVVHTPWYGWAIIGAATVTAGTAFWWFVVR